MPYLLEMKNITKTFGSVKAIDNVCLRLNAGEIVSLCGENGSGKSTLMKILSGVYSLDQGSLKIFGKDYSSLTPSSAREAGVAIIHQELNMCKDLTVAQNMFLGREERKGFVLNNSNMEDIARKYLGELGVDISPDEIVGELPVSKQQMIEIAKALSINAKILIMDEPTRGIDVGAKVEIYQLMNQLKKQGIAVMFVSSEMPEVMGVADRIIVMCDGRITGEVMAKETTQNDILKYATSFENKLESQSQNNKEE